MTSDPTRPNYRRPYQKSRGSTQNSVSANFLNRVQVTGLLRMTIKGMSFRVLVVTGDSTAACFSFCFFSLTHSKYKGPLVNTAKS